MMTILSVDFLPFPIGSSAVVINVEALSPEILRRFRLKDAGDLSAANKL